MSTAFLENVPSGAYYLTVGFSAILFILLYLRWTSDVFSQRHFKIFFRLAASVALLAFGFLFIFQDKPIEKTRVAVLPFFNAGKDAQTEWMAWALPDIIEKNLHFESATECFGYPLSDIREMVITDSLNFPDYQKHLAQQLKLQFFITGRIDTLAQAWICKYQLQSTDSGTIVSEGFKFDNIDTLYARGLKIAKKFQNRTYDQKVSEPSILPSFRTSSLVSYYSAQKAYCENDIVTANTLINQAIKADSTNPCLWLLQAETKMKEGALAKKNGKSYQSEYDLAWRCLETAHQMDSSLTQINQLRAQYYILTEKWADAEQELIRIYHKNPNLPIIYLYFSQLHPSRFKIIDFQNEEELLKNALFLNPGYLAAAINLANYYIDYLQDQSKAIEVLNNILKINPHQTEILMRLGQLYIATSDNFNVMETYKKILELEPGNANAYYNLGIYYYNQKDSENALSLFERAIQIDDHLDAHLYAAYILESKSTTATDSVQRDSLLNQAIEHYRFRLKNKRGKDDLYAKEAREHLYRIFHN